MPTRMWLRIWDVEHGACAMLQHAGQTATGETWSSLAMVDSGSTADWSPSDWLVQRRYERIAHLFVTNADQDHMSDLHRLEEAGLDVKTFYRNKSYTGAQIRDLKRQSGPLSADAQWYVTACDRFSGAVTEPFNENMGGVTYRAFYNDYSNFENPNTNDLSLAVFFTYQGFTILFPGDLEKAGWRMLLRNPNFTAQLAQTTALVASHHGRESGFCEEVFEYLKPQVVVISDKPIQHETQQMVPDYRNIISGDGVHVNGHGRRRHVLTTRRDGWIQFEVHENGQVSISTEYGG
jgi:beta-lactamase superfamily II metal-dependent hydrolase